MTLLLGYLVMVEVAFVTLGTLDLLRAPERLPGFTPEALR